MNNHAEWAHLDDAQLLEWPIRKLGLSVEESPLQPLVQQLYEELAARMSVPLGTMKSWIRRAMIKLKTCLER